MKQDQIVIPSAEPFLFRGDSTGCLLIHGFTGTPKEMRWMGEFLAHQGRTVLGIRLAGHATQPADLVRTNRKDWFASVEDGIHMLSSACSRVFLAGLSMGGVLALLSASRFPVDGVIAMSTPHNLLEENLRDPRFKILPLLSPFIPEISKGTPEWHEPINYTDHISYPKYPTPSIREFVKTMEEMRASLPSLKMPLLIIQSHLDHTIPGDSLEYISSHVSSSDIEKIWLNQSNHVITREPERQVVFQAASDFINRILNQNTGV